MSDTTDTIPAQLSEADARARLEKLGYGADAIDGFLRNAGEVIFAFGQYDKPHHRTGAAILRAYVAGQAAAPSQPAAPPAQGASLEARARWAWGVKEIRTPDVAAWEALPETERVSWRTVVRAVDASRPAPSTATLATARPALSEERARAERWARQYWAQHRARSFGTVDPVEFDSLPPDEREAEIAAMLPLVRDASRGDDGAPGESGSHSDPFTPDEAAEIIASAPGQIAPGQQPIARRRTGVFGERVTLLAGLDEMAVTAGEDE